MIELLCDLGADLFREGVNSAISSRGFDAIKVLCDKGAELRLSSLARAIKTNDLNVVKLFSELIVNADEERQANILHQTAIDGSFEILHWLVTGQPNGTGLKLKPDKYSRTVLHHAALRNTRDMCQGILENKLADVSCKNNEGKTAIDTAVEYNNWSVVLCLLKNGASGTGELLIQAQAYDDLEVIQILVEEKGIDIDHQDDYGQTALEKSSGNIACWLLRKGATYKQPNLT
jgi:hypothetical protein